jgi:hypothetical protein
LVGGHPPYNPPGNPQGNSSANAREFPLEISSHPRPPMSLLGEEFEMAHTDTTPEDRLQQLIEALPSHRREDNGHVDWALWTGELILAMQRAGATTRDIFETFLWEAGVIAEGKYLSLSEAKNAIEKFSRNCAELVGVGQQGGGRPVN